MNIFPILYNKFAYKFSVKFLEKILKCPYCRESREYTYKENTFFLAYMNLAQVKYGVSKARVVFDDISYLVYIVGGV